MTREQFRRRVSTAAIGLALAGVTVAALTGDTVHGLWATHPFLAGLATGALTLAFTILIVGRVIARRDNRHWRHVAAVAYRGLARESRDVCAGLASLYCDLDHRIGATYEDPNWTTFDLTPLGEIRFIPDGKEQVQALHRSDLPPVDDPDDLLPEERVRLLLTERTWAALAASHLDGLVDRNREAVAHWAPLLMSAEEPRDLLNAFASLNDELFSLQVKLRHLATYGVGTDSQDVIDHWRIVDGKARLLTNRLWRTAGEGHYSLRIPPGLTDHDGLGVFQHLGRLGKWRATVIETYGTSATTKSR